MQDFLVADAMQKVWCSPGQDRQAVIKPQRITPKLGTWNFIHIPRRSISLPTNNERYHVFQLGQLYPAALNWLPIQEQWVKFSQVCDTVNLIIDLYTNPGYHFPVTDSYYFITTDRNILVAVKEHPTIQADLVNEDLYFRVYTNAFYNSNRCDHSTMFVKTAGGRPLNTNDLLALQHTYDDWQSLPGHTFVYVNGYLVDALNLFTAQVGDYVELIHDGSVYRVIDLPVANLEVFTSTLDAKQKYLVHYPGQGLNRIDYLDDIEIYLTKSNGNGHFKGVYYHRNQEDSVRMLTHKDYSIVVPYVASYASGQDGWLAQDMGVRLVLRNAGYNRPLVNENARISELYKANDSDVIRAMVGVDSTVDVWKAPNLEAAKYPTVMRSAASDVTNDMVRDAYGYSAIANLIGKTPAAVYVDSNQRIADVPPGLRSACICYEYDAQGLLKGYYQHYRGTYYLARNPQTVWVEMISGFLKDTLYEGYGLSGQVLDPAVDYRFYTCPIVNGIETNEWTDVTGTDQYSIANNILHWNVDAANTYTMSRGDLYVLAYSLDLPMPEGVLKFSLVSKQRRHEQWTDTVMQVPMGVLDVFLNGHPLIEDIDYIINFPEVVIISKAYLINPDTQTQHIDLRYSGLCQPDLTMAKNPDQGFVVNGLLSKNNYYDLRDGRVLRIVVGGSFYDKSQLKFAETDTAITVPNAMNGKPYMIRDIVVPIQNFVVGDTYALRDVDKVINKQIGDYLTLKLPEPVVSAPNAIVGLYQTFSPFCAKILFDLIQGDLVDTRIQGHYGDAVVFEICKPYEWLLAFDPTQDAHLPDGDYVVIHPHHLNHLVSVNIYIYSFITRIVKLYLKNRVQLSDFLVLA